MIKPASPQASPIQAYQIRLEASLQERFWLEFLRNTGQLPMAVLMLELFLEGWKYLLKADLYILFLAAIFQAWWLSRRIRQAKQIFLGNLFAPTLYTVFEGLLEGVEFWYMPQHQAYWGFALFLGLLQSLQSLEYNRIRKILIVAENLVRSQILFTVYAIYEIQTVSPERVDFLSFMSESSHLLIFLMTLIFGIAIGLADLNSRELFNTLQKTARQLKIYSEWLLGRNLLERAFSDPASMQLTRRYRTILFMDIRGFTYWAESRTPEEVAAFLTEYYLKIEIVLQNYRVIKLKFTADEAMAVFVDAQEAFDVAQLLHSELSTLLARQSLGVGIGIHTGEVVEGILGGHELRFYDVLGDTVNTAQRIEAAAGSMEIWVSAEAFSQIRTEERFTQKEIQVKGKTEPIQVFVFPFERKPDAVEETSRLQNAHSTTGSQMQKAHPLLQSD